jgi:hypothetical protein
MEHQDFVGEGVVISWTDVGHNLARIPGRKSIHMHVCDVIAIVDLS